MSPSFNDLLDVVEQTSAVAVDELGIAGPYLEFSPAEYGHRFAKARALMTEVGIDALVLAEPSNVRYFTGLRSWFTALPPVLPILAVITRDPRTSTVIDTATEKGSIEAASWIADPELYGADGDAVHTVIEALRRRDLLSGRLGMELGWGRLPHLSPVDLDRLRAQVRGEVVDASHILSAARAIKSSAEIEALRRAADLISVGFQAVCSNLAEGVTEVEMARVAASAIADAGGVDELSPNVFIFMAGADRYRMPLLPATGRRVQRDELISLDGGCSFMGYHSDFARGAVIGELEDESAEQFAVSVEALEAAESALKAGVPVSDAWTASDKVLRSADLAQHAVNPRNIGHSIGLDHWELPTVGTPESEMGAVTARSGMVVCVEPQIAGARGDDTWARGLFLVEDQLLITDDGVDVLTSRLPRSLFVCGG